MFFCNDGYHAYPPRRKGLKEACGTTWIGRLNLLRSLTGKREETKETSLFFLRDAGMKQEREF